jgi:hypothetical protein
VNRVVDIGPTLVAKHAAIRACRTMVQNMLHGVNASLAARKLRVPALAGDEAAAIDEYIKAVFERRDAEIGKAHGLEYAEQYHHISPDTGLEAYISRNAVPL